MPRPVSRPKSALDSLLCEEKLAPVIRRARWLDILGRHLHARLPSPLNLHAKLANIDGDTLIYLVDSPVWNARLRLSTDALLEAAHGIGLKVKTLRIRTARQPFDQYTQTLADIDARMQRNHGTSSAEARVLAEARALLGEDADRL